MIFQKQYGDIVVNFECTYSAKGGNEWTIWAIVDGVKYSSEILHHIIISIQNLPKQIQFLMDRFDSTFDKINEDIYALTIDYVLLDEKPTILLRSPKLRPQYKIENWLLDIHRNIKNTNYIFPLTIKKYSSWGWLYKIDNPKKLSDISMPVYQNMAFSEAYKTIKDILANSLPDEITIIAEHDCVELFGFPTLTSGEKLDIKYLYKCDSSLVICKETGDEIKIYLGDFLKFTLYHSTLYWRVMDHRIIE